MQTLNFLFAAYSAIWVVFFLYLYSLWRKQNKIEEGLRRLEAKIAKERK